MPYIKKENRRHWINPSVDGFWSCIKHDTSAGDLNFLITTILHKAGPKNYARINELIGVLECAKLELYRRIAVPYEDMKILENGDVINEK